MTNILPTNWKLLKSVCLRAPSPTAFLAGMPPVPRSQSTWIMKMCADLSNAMSALPEGKKNG